MGFGVFVLLPSSTTGLGVFVLLPFSTMGFGVFVLLPSSKMGFKVFVPLPYSTMARRDNTGVEAVLSDELEKWILTAWNGCATPILHTIANVQSRV